MLPHTSSIRTTDDDDSDDDIHGGPSHALAVTTGDSEAQHKERKRIYRVEKQLRQERLTHELTDKGTLLQSGWLKLRGAFKNWTKYWCTLRPGVLNYFVDERQRELVGSILLSGCEVIERPTKKSGFCFKIYHPLRQPIFGTKGPRGEVLVSGWMSLHSDFAILRAPTADEGSRWLRNISAAICADLPTVSKHSRGAGTHPPDHAVDATPDTLAYHSPDRDGTLRDL